jgi:hypothetical protein
MLRDARDFRGSITRVVPIARILRQSDGRRCRYVRKCKCRNVYVYTRREYYRRCIHIKIYRACRSRIARRTWYLYCFTFIRKEIVAALGGFYDELRFTVVASAAATAAVTAAATPATMVVATATAPAAVLMPPGTAPATPHPGAAAAYGNQDTANNQDAGNHKDTALCSFSFHTLPPLTMSEAGGYNARTSVYRHRITRIIGILIKHRNKSIDFLFRYILIM